MWSLVNAKGCCISAFKTKGKGNGSDSAPPIGTLWSGGTFRFGLVAEVIRWIFFMWTFKWSVLLKTCPHIRHGCGTNRPWCWCRTCRSKVHFKLKLRLHSVHRNRTWPSAFWYCVYTLWFCALFNLFSLGTLFRCDPDPAVSGSVRSLRVELLGVAEREGAAGGWAVKSPSMFGHPTSPVSATERETQSVWVFVCFCRNY